MVGRLRRRFFLPITVVTVAASTALLSGVPTAGAATVAGTSKTVASSTGSSVGATSTPGVSAAARAKQQALAQTPYMGWSSWSLESTNYPGVNPNGGASFLTEQHVLQQADVMAATLKSHGYTYVNIDAGWANEDRKSVV